VRVTQRASYTCWGLGADSSRRLFGQRFAKELGSCVLSCVLSCVRAYVRVCVHASNPVAITPRDRYNDAALAFLPRIRRRHATTATAAA
jgi:hypothetical protein